MKKQILKISTITILLISVFVISCGQEPKPLVPDPGVVSFTFRNQFQEDVPGTLDMIKEMGFNHIEFSNLFGETAESMRQLLDERGLACTSYGVGYGALVNETDRVAEEAITLGAKYVRVAWIPHEGEFSAEDVQRTAEDFNRAGKKLREKGIYFCYHNHGFEFRPYRDGTLFDYLVELTNPEYVSFQMDIFWVAHPGADPVELLEKYPDRFRLMHLKDLKKGVVGNLSGRSERDNDVILGTGQIDIPAVLRAAQNTNIEFFYIEDETADVVERVPISREFILSITE